MFRRWFKVRKWWCKVVCGGLRWFEVVEEELQDEENESKGKEIAKKAKLSKWTKVCTSSTKLGIYRKKTQPWGCMGRCWPKCFKAKRKRKISHLACHSKAWLGMVQNMVKYGSKYGLGMVLWLTKLIMWNTWKACIFGHIQPWEEKKRFDHLMVV